MVTCLVYGDNCKRSCFGNSGLIQLLCEDYSGCSRLLDHSPRLRNVSCSALQWMEECPVSCGLCPA